MVTVNVICLWPVISANTMEAGQFLLLVVMTSAQKDAKREALVCQ